MAIALVVSQIVNGNQLKILSLKATQMQFSSIWVEVDHSHAKNTKTLSYAENIKDHALEQKNY